MHLIFDYHATVLADIVEVLGPNLSVVRMCRRHSIAHSISEREENTHTSIFKYPVLLFLSSLLFIASRQSSTRMSSLYFIKNNKNKQEFHFVIFGTVGLLAAEYTHYTNRFVYL